MLQIDKARIVIAQLNGHEFTNAELAHLKFKNTNSVLDDLEARGEIYQCGEIEYLNRRNTPYIKKVWRATAMLQVPKESGISVGWSFDGLLDVFREYATEPNLAGTVRRYAIEI